MVAGLWKAFLHALGYVSPFLEGDMHCLGVFALFPSKIAKKVDQMISDVVLDSRTITNGVHIPKGSAVETKVGVGLERVFISLDFEFVGNAFAEFTLS